MDLARKGISNKLMIFKSDNREKTAEFLRSAKKVHVCIFAQKTLLGYFLNNPCCVDIYLFVILPLFCNNFDRKSTYLNFKKSAEKILARFC